MDTHNYHQAIKIPKVKGHNYTVTTKKAPAAPEQTTTTSNNTKDTLHTVDMDIIKALVGTNSLNTQNLTIP